MDFQIQQDRRFLICHITCFFSRERDERKLQQRTNPKGSVTVNINATDLFNRYKDDINYDER